MTRESYLLQRAHELGAFLYKKPVQIITASNPRGALYRNRFTISLYASNLNIDQARAKVNGELLSISHDEGGHVLLGLLVHTLEDKIGDFMSGPAGNLQSDTKESTRPPAPLSAEGSRISPSPMAVEGLFPYVPVPDPLPEPEPDYTGPAYNPDDARTNAMPDPPTAEELRVVIREEINAGVRRVLESLSEVLKEQL